MPVGYTEQGEPVPVNWQILDVLTLMGGIMERLAKYEEEDHQYDDQLGETYPNRIDLKAGKQIIKLDFVEMKHQNLPPGETVDVPGIPVRRVILYNESTTALVGFSTKSDMYIREDGDAGIMLKAGETFEIESPRNTIRRLNLVAPFTDARVRVTLIV